MTNVTPLFPDRGDPSPFMPLSIANPRLEQFLVGTLLTNPAWLELLPLGFDAEHYDDPLHRDIHRAIVAVGQPGVPAAIMVSEAMGFVDKEQRSYLADLLVACMGSLSVRPYAEALTQNYRRRQLLVMADEMREAAYDAKDDGSADAAMAVTMNKLDLLASGHSRGGRDAVSMNDAMDAALRHADEAAHRGGPAGLLTGFRAIDMRLGGMDPGDLVVLGGRPGMGKSGLGWQFAVNAARRGIAVCAISQEMSAMALGRRALAAMAGVSVEALKQGRHGPYADRLREARRELHDLPISIEDGGGMRPALIAMKVRGARRRHKGLGLVMVDHIHITPPEGADAKHGPTFGVGQVSASLKRLAKAEQLPVLALAQLNRGVENREDKRPTLADLRQSGDIEQDADAVMFLYRQEMYMLHEPEQAPGENQQRFTTRLDEWRNARTQARGRAEVICAKVRDGETGMVPLAFDGPTTSFSEAGHAQ